MRFEVADTGIGVDPAKLSSIFEAFTQADGSHSRQFGGTGLGLTITRRLVNLMGGRLWAESAIGAGSRFFVELPLARTEVAARAATAPDPPPRIPAGLKILVAEDNPINQKVICAMLRRHACDIVLAANGEEACRRFLAACAEPHPDVSSSPRITESGATSPAVGFDLVLMDVQMPEVDGLEATRCIRNQEASRHLPRTPVLALTAHASRVHHEQCLASGMDGVITKPLNQVELLSRIAAALRAPDPERLPVSCAVPR